MLAGALTWVIFALGAIIFALLGIFWKPLIITLFFATFFGFIVVVFLKGWHRTASLELFAILIISFFVAYIWTQYTQPTIFSGRDQGSISEAAIRLTENQILPFSTIESQEFFKIYGPGKALNFPGFFYSSNGSLVTQFPLGYICWLGAWFSLLGIFGLILANTLLAWFFLIMSYALMRRFVSPLPSWLFFLLCSTSFQFVWFSRFTLSENMALPLLITSILSLHLFTLNSRRGSYAVWFLSTLTLALTRIEGLAIAFVGLMVIFSYRHTRHYIRKHAKYTLAIPAAASLVLLTLSAYHDWAFYREMAKVIKRIVMPTTNQISAIDTSLWLENLHFWKILWSYSLAPYIILGLVVIAIAFIKGRFRLLLPFFIALPTFIYLADPHISIDHPWMLRRYMFAAVPICMMYSVIGLTKIFNSEEKNVRRMFFKISAIFFISALFIGNVIVLKPYATFAENRTLFEQTEELSAKFSSDDLILIDRTATGDGWAMITNPMSSLLGKHAVYIFNISDIEKIDRSKFAKTFLIIPKQTEDEYLQKLGDKIKPFCKYFLSTQRLEIINKTRDYNKVSLPQIKDVVINGTIYEYN